MAHPTAVNWLIDASRHPLGRLVDRRTIRYERIYPVSVERLWDALIDEKQLESWYIHLPTRLDRKLGGHFWFGDEADEVMSGVVTDLDPGHRLLLAFRNSTGALFTLEPGGDGTALTYTHWLHAGFTLPQDADDEETRRWNYQPGGPGTYQPALAACWHGSLCALDHHLGGRWPDGPPASRPGGMFPETWYAPYCDLFVSTLPDW
jgi:uncharacterized protein YndB with AHSA1/START domain